MKCITRVNQQWMDELLGLYGEEKRLNAFEDLGRYLYKVAVTNLNRRSNDIVYLSKLPKLQIEQYAEDFVQDTLVKLTEKDNRRLCQYRGEGKFTSWVAQILINCIRDELRGTHWHRSIRQAENAEYLPETAVRSNPEEQAMGTTLRERITVHAKNLSPKSRSAFVRCVVNEEPISLVAEEMGLSPNALYIQISRGKHYLRGQLMREGLTPGV